MRRMLPMWIGFASNILENKEALELLKTAIAKASYTDQVVISMDVAVSEFYRSSKYELDFKPPDDPNRYITPDHLADLYRSFIQNHPVVSSEEPFERVDWDAWQKFTASAGIQVVGDDLTVTNSKWIAKTAGEKSCNCLRPNVNQIGSVTESLQACKLAQSNGRGVMVSHRSGETEDTFIADVVVGLCTGQIKTNLSAWPSTVRSLELRKSWAAKPSLLAGPSEPPGQVKQGLEIPGATSCLGPLSLMSSRHLKAGLVLPLPDHCFLRCSLLTIRYPAGDPSFVIM